MGPKITIEPGSSYLASVFHKLPETSMENFYISRFGRKLYSMFFEGIPREAVGPAILLRYRDQGAQSQEP